MVLVHVFVGLLAVLSLVRNAAQSHYGRSYGGLDESGGEPSRGLGIGRVLQGGDAFWQEEDEEEEAGQSEGSADGELEDFWSDSSPEP